MRRLRKQARRSRKLRIARIRFQRLLQKRCQIEASVHRPPRYDKIFYQGVAWLDTL